LIYAAVILLVAETLAPFAWMFISSHLRRPGVAEHATALDPRKTKPSKRYAAILLPHLLENDPGGNADQNIGVFAHAV